MATLYCDFLNGNNSNDGTSFANRVLTWTGGITAARTAPGDVIRMMKSETPVSIGNATWTNKSGTVTLASALTKTIYTDGAWTASTDVTASTTSTRKEGSNASQLAIAGPFGTGKVAYYDLGSTQDFSGFDSICCQLRSAPGVAGSVFSIKLCSDATGDTPVDTLSITEALVSSQFKPYFKSNGSALSSTVRSVALYADSDPGTTTLIIDNILGCNANSIDLTSVITKSSSETNLEYYTIRSIVGTTVLLEASANSLQTVAVRGYYGTTETVTTYKVRPIRISATQTIQEAGTAASKSTYSGGWDMTNMSTQTGVTIVDIGDENASIFVSSVSHLNFEYLVAVRGTIGFSLTGDNFALSHCAGTGNNSNSGSSFALITGNGFYLTDCHSYHCAQRGFALNVQIVNAVFDSCISNSHINSSGFTASGNSAITFINCTGNNNAVAGWDIANGVHYLNKPTAKDNATYGILGTSAHVTVIAPTTSANGTAGLQAANGAIILVDDTTNCSDSTVYGTNASHGIIQVSRVAGAAGDARVRMHAVWVIQKATTPVHGSTTYSYQHTPVSGKQIVNAPLIQRCKPFAVDSTGTLTISIWVRRDHASNVSAKLVVRGMQVDGISTDLTDTISVGADTWEQLTVSGSPSEKVPIQVELHSWNTTTTSTHNIFFGDATVTQA